MTEVIATKTRIADVLLSFAQAISYVWALLACLAIYTYATEGYPLDLLINIPLGLAPVAVVTGMRSLLARKLKPAPFK